VCVCVCVCVCAFPAISSLPSFRFNKHVVTEMVTATATATATETGVIPSNLLTWRKSWTLLQVGTRRTCYPPVPGMRHDVDQGPDPDPDPLLPPVVVVILRQLRIVTLLVRHCCDNPPRPRKRTPYFCSSSWYRLLLCFLDYSFYSQHQWVPLHQYQYYHYY